MAKKSTDTRDELSITLYLQSEIKICSVRMPVNALVLGLDKICFFFFLFCFSFMLDKSTYFAFPIHPFCSLFHPFCFPKIPFLHTVIKVQAKIRESQHT